MLSSRLIVISLTLIQLCQSKGPLDKNKFKDIITKYLGEQQVKHELSNDTVKFCEEQSSRPLLQYYIKSGFTQYQEKGNPTPYKVMIFACNEHVITFDIHDLIFLHTHIHLEKTHDCRSGSIHLK